MIHIILLDDRDLKGSGESLEIKLFINASKAYAEGVY